MARPNIVLKGENNVTSRSWFAVFCNPAEHGYDGTPEEVCHRLRDEWCDGYPTRSGAWAYCISAEGMHHVHMVLEDKKVMRFSAVKKAYACGMHFEATRGNKQQVDDYINKRGAFEEKGEQVIYIVTEGEIVGNQGKRSDLSEIYGYIEDGLTPAEVLATNPNYYKYSTYIKQMYFDKRCADTPLVRSVKVYWHCGESGSGKSYSRIALAEEVGEENIFYLTAFGNGAFDGYNGQPYLWIEDFKGEMMFGELLRILDVYKAEISCRYTNAKALWKEVHITSIFHPRGVYRKMVSESEQGQDKIDQLLRRIDREGCIRYHWKDDNGYHYSEWITAATLEEMRQSAARGEEWRLDRESRKVYMQNE